MKSQENKNEIIKMKGNQVINELQLLSLINKKKKTYNRDGIWGNRRKF